MFGWLFRQTLTKDQAVAVATRFLEGNGYRVVATEADADFSKEDLHVVLQRTELPSRRWYIHFRLLTPPGVWRSHTLIIVQVNAHSGEAKFDGPEVPQGS